MYALVQGAQLADNSGLLRQGSLAISWSALPFAIYSQSRFRMVTDGTKTYRVTAVHTGLLVGLFWVLVWAAFLSLQIVEDGTLFSLIVSSLRHSWDSAAMRS